MFRRICIPGNYDGIGGPVSFNKKISGGLVAKGISVTYDLDDEPYDAILVINATRQMAKLRRCKKSGIPIIQRLGGINWLHRHLPIGLRGFGLSEVRNAMMRFIRSFMADKIVYQSNFVREWWTTKYGTAKAPSVVIRNGVDLTEFSPQGPRYRSKKDVCILSVEGTQMNPEHSPAFLTAQALKNRATDVELLVFGNSSAHSAIRYRAFPFVNFHGQVPNAELPYYYRGASFFVSNDVIAACPNSVIEALACGTPVLGYRAGVLPEIVDDSSGRFVECDGNPLKGEAPGNQEAMIAAAVDLVANRDRYSAHARRLAEERYGLDSMVEEYVRALYS